MVNKSWGFDTKAWCHTTYRVPSDPFVFIRVRYLYTVNLQGQVDTSNRYMLCLVVEDCRWIVEILQQQFWMSIGRLRFESLILWIWFSVLNYSRTFHIWPLRDRAMARTAKSSDFRRSSVCSLRDIGNHLLQLLQHPWLYLMVSATVDRLPWLQQHIRSVFWLTERTLLFPHPRYKTSRWSGTRSDIPRSQWCRGWI